MIDASKGFKKEGPKNQLRDRDIHKIVDTFTKEIEIQGYSRMVPIMEIENTKNNFNLNLPRYIDTTEREDLHDIEGHLQGGIPNKDIDALSHYWQIFPSLRELLFKKNRSGYSSLKISPDNIKSFIFNHSEFKVFNAKVTKLFEKFITNNIPRLKKLSKDDNPKIIIKTITESLLSTFKSSPLIDHYGIYQRLMNYWDETMQDDFYLIVAEGWKKSVKPREISKVKDRNNKLVWQESYDYLKGKQRFKSDLIPAEILVSNYFVLERDAINVLNSKLSNLEQKLNEMIEENNDEEGLLTEVIEGENDKQKITAKAIKERLKEIEKDQDYFDEHEALQACSNLLEQKTKVKTKIRITQENLDKKIDEKYSKLTEDEIKTLIINKKWMHILDAAVQDELDHVSQTLTGRIHELSKRYAFQLTKITDEVTTLSSLVAKHLKKMGF
jgi:type I restriction enzyme M protein